MKFRFALNGLYELKQAGTVHMKRKKSFSSYFPFDISPVCEMLLLLLSTVPRSTGWTPTKKWTKCSYKGLALCCRLCDLSADLACPCGQCALLQDRDIHCPSSASMCSPTHSFNEKKLHFPIVCSKMMEVHWGQKDVWRNTISTESRPQMCHQSECHRTNIFKAQSQTFDLLCFDFVG